MVLPRFIVVVGGCDRATSIVRFMESQGVDVWSTFFARLGPVCWVVVWSRCGSLILLLGGVEALLDLFELVSSSCPVSPRSSLLPPMFLPFPLL